MRTLAGLLIYIAAIHSFTHKVFTSKLSYYSNSFQLQAIVNEEIKNDQAVGSIAELPRLLSITSSSKPSFFKRKPSKEPVTWNEVFNEVASKIAWEAKNDKYDDKLGPIQLQTITSSNIHTNQIANPEILFLAGLDESEENPETIQEIQDLAVGAAVVCVHDCSKSFAKLQRFGSYTPPMSTSDIISHDSSNCCSGEGDSGNNTPQDMSAVQEWLEKVLKSERYKHKQLYSLANNMWSRRSKDDLIFMVLVLVDAFTSFPVKSVKAVTSSDVTTIPQIQKMCAKCGKEILNCFMDPQCRAALACLDSCSGNDQVCQYRCITSHETPTFEKFSACILQKHNCMGNSATVPVYPDPSPIQMFQGKPVTHEIAEDIFIGHIKQYPSEAPNSLFGDNGYEPLRWSWKVVCGQNPAYDYFDCQHQLFYRDRRRRSAIWYDPVFKVRTFSGEEVWRRRHYRVRRGKVPGQFYFSVQDNGVVSSEFWRILDCADDLSWAVFYYGGAASAAGTSYIGALVVTPNGHWPEMTTETSARIEKALRSAEITMWELFEVDNDSCSPNSKVNPPPLDLPM